MIATKLFVSSDIGVLQRRVGNAQPCQKTFGRFPCSMTANYWSEPWWSWDNHRYSWSTIQGIPKVTLNPLVHAVKRTQCMENGDHHKVHVISKTWQMRLATPYHILT